MILFLVVAIGVSATIAYQVNLYYDSAGLSTARSAQNVPPLVGG
jgi:hypothetical protein